MHVNFKPMGGDLVGGLPNPAASMLQAQIFGQKNAGSLQFLPTAKVAGTLYSNNAVFSLNPIIPASIGDEVLRMIQANGAVNRLLMDSFAGANVLTVRRANGTSASPSAVSSGDFIFGFSSQGYGTTGYTGTIAAAMLVQATGNWSDTSTPTKIFFDVTASGTTTRATVLTCEPTAVTAAVPVITPGYTVATLPTGVLGMRAYVTDALAPTYNAVLVGGGAIKVPAFYNGTAWVAA